MTQGVFVTGTDTEVGKTVVSAGILTALAEKGIRCAGMKPVASGCELVDGQMQNQDALALIQAGNVEVPYDWVNPYAFEPAIAPHIAANQVDVTVELSRIAAAYQSLTELADVVIVEGVGGWKVPLAPDLMLADLVTALDLPVIMVVGIRLGCINHALLTQQAIHRDGFSLLGWVANCVDPNTAVASDILATLREHIGAPCMGVVPFLHDELRDDVAAHLDLTPLASPNSL